MSKQIISRHAASSVEELRAALDSFELSAGEHPSTIYVYVGGEEVHLALEEETLSDGSKVYNLRLFPRYCAPAANGEAA